MPGGFYPLAMESTDKTAAEEINLKILCACSELNHECGKLRIMNTTFLSSKKAEQCLNNMASEGLLVYNKESKKCAITDKGSLLLKENHSKQSPSP
jgi:predicted transcriptional regulator